MTLPPVCCIVLCLRDQRYLFMPNKPKPPLTLALWSWYKYGGYPKPKVLVYQQQLTGLTLHCALYPLHAGAQSHLALYVIDLHIYILRLGVVAILHCVQTFVDCGNIC